jgi:hypothetical protein
MASVASGFREVDSLDSKRNPPWPAVRSRKILILSHNFRQGRRGGFEVDSPVKKPDARKLARSAPPYTNRVGEEPCRRGYHARRGSLSSNSDVPLIFAIQSAVSLFRHLTIVSILPRSARRSREKIGS